jgi:mycofactocin glycosyltransferase
LTAVDTDRGRPVALPPGFRITLDPGVRWVGDGEGLVGGSPIRWLRLSPAGRALVHRLVAGEPVPPSDAAQRLTRRLLDAGLAHPRPPALPGSPDLAAVIPVRNDAAGLAATVAALVPQRAGRAVRAYPTSGAVADDGRIRPASAVAPHDAPVGPSSIVVADDASAVPVDQPAGVAGADVTVVRRRVRGGPAAARNDGWRATGAEFVAFVDANCEPEPGWLARLLPHFGDPLVAAVAPRIVTAPHPAAPGWLVAYEQVCSPLDLGAREANVRPRSPVPYVPTAALVVRRAALAAVGGFDETLRFGEDVDLVWRLVAAGWTVRYEPAATVRHPMRPTPAACLAQRFAYGTSAAPLARRHGAAVAPAVLSPWTATAWALLAAGQPLTAAAAAAAAAYSVAALAGTVPAPWKLRRPARQSDHPPVRLPIGEAVRLAGGGHLLGGLTLARAIRRAWPPAAIVLAAASRRSRPALLAALAVPTSVEWMRRRPAVDPVRFAGLHLADDLAYAAGLWTGCVRERSLGALRPEFGTTLRRRPRQTGGSPSPSIGGRP